MILTIFARLRLVVIGVAIAAAIVACGRDRPGTSDSVVSRLAADSAGDQPCVFDGDKRRWTCGVSPGRVIRAEVIPDTAPNTYRELRIETVAGQGNPLVIRAPDFSGSLTGEEVTTADIDGDGIRELVIAREYGHPNNTGAEFYFWQPETRSFVRDSLISDETNVTPDSTGCVRTQGYLGRGDYEEKRFCRRGREWVLVWKHEQIEDSTGVPREREYRLRNGRLVVVPDTT
jgi:hypothetical protein